MTSWRSDLLHAAFGAFAVASITAGYFMWLHVSDVMVVAFSYLAVVLVVAATSRLGAALATSAIAALSLNFFFLAPVLTLTGDDVAAFIAYVVVSVVAGRLSAVARGREDDLRKLLDFSRDVLREDDADAVGPLTEHLLARFALAYVAIYLPSREDFTCFQAGAVRHPPIPTTDLLARTLRSGSRLMIWQGAPSPSARLARLVRLHSGRDPVGVMVLAGRHIDDATVNALSSVVAIAIERARLLRQRQDSEVERHSVEIKSALLASLEHDLRTPLTSLATAIDNLGNVRLSPADRAHQSTLARRGVQCLAHIFQNIMNMARIDAGRLDVRRRWVHASEVVEAAKQEIEHTLRDRLVVLQDDSVGHALNLDPKLVATALARLLENAARYSPAGAPIIVTARTGTDEISFTVEDEGPGVPPEDESRVFERFYRGAHAVQSSSGTGMGLAIAHGLVNALRGRTQVANRPTGGASFTISLPAEVRPANAGD